jgi:glycosyltransferase involved in cell wall biosynthesis
MLFGPLIICLYDPVNLTFEGGGEKWIVETATRLSNLGHTVHVLSTRWPKPMDNCKKNGYPFKYIEIPQMPLPYAKLPRRTPLPSPTAIRQILDEFNNSDIIYSFVIPPDELLFGLVKGEIKVPIIGGFHSFLRDDLFWQHLYVPLMKHTLRAFDAVHVLNNQLLKVFQSQKIDTFFIPNGVDTSVFDLCEPPLSSSTFKVLFVGRLAEEKGVKVLIKIVKGVNLISNMTVKFVIAGTGPLQTELQEALKDANVKFLGHIPHREIHKLYRNSSMLLLPSFIEGMPNSVLEAQSCGLPVVGSNVPGISDIIRNGSGILVDLGDVDGFVNAINYYYRLWKTEPSKYRESSLAIRDYTIQNFDWNKIDKKIEAMFIEIAAKKRH